MDNGCILPNTIRNSILDLEGQIKNDKGMKVVERDISIHEIINANKEGRLVEIIGCSTSSFIQPINKIVYKDQNI